MPCPSHSPWLDHPNYIWRRVQIMKVFITNLFPSVLPILPSSIQISPQHGLIQTAVLWKWSLITFWLSSHILHHYVSMTQTQIYYLRHSTTHSRLHWSCDLRHELSSLARTLGSWVRIQLKRHGCLCLFILCVVSGLPTGWSPVQGGLLTVYRIKNLKNCTEVQQKGRRTIDR
jgi:hypothetical protein